MLNDRQRGRAQGRSCILSGSGDLGHMNASTPWWGTLVVAAIGLLGVLWSQRLTARRDVAERTDRLRAVRASLYADFQRTVSALTMALLQDDKDQFRSKQDDYLHAVLLITTSGAPTLGPSLDGVSQELGRLLDHWPSTKADRERAVGVVGSHLAIATALMRFDVSGRRVPRSLRAWQWLRHPRRRFRAARWRWREHLTVLGAELEQPVWPLGDGRTAP